MFRSCIVLYSFEDKQFRVLHHCSSLNQPEQPLFINVGVSQKTEKFDRYLVSVIIIRNVSGNCRRIRFSFCSFRDWRDFAVHSCLRLGLTLSCRGKKKQTQASCSAVEWLLSAYPVLLRLDIRNIVQLSPSIHFLASSWCSPDVDCNVNRERRTNKNRNANNDLKRKRGKVKSSLPLV